METKYELTTIKDIFDKIPSDKIEACMKELTEAMIQAAIMRDISNAAVAGMGNVTVEWPVPVTWIDDDKGEVDVTFTLDNEPIFNTKTTVK